MPQHSIHVPCVACRRSAIVAVPGAQPPPAPLTVAAAVSLTEALEEIAEGLRGGRRRTGALQLRRLERARAPDRQRRAGRRLHQRRRSADGRRREGRHARGRLARRPRCATSWRSSRLPERAALVREQFARAAAGDSPPRDRRSRGGAGRRLRAAVPRAARDCGRRYEPRIVPTTNVRAALTAVETGGADAAIVYRHRRARVARAAPMRRRSRVPAESDGPRIVIRRRVISSTSPQPAPKRRRSSRSCAGPTGVRRSSRGHKFVAAGAVAAGRWTLARLMDIWQITGFTLLTALGATAADDPARAAAGVAARAPAVSRPRARRDVRLAAARDAAGRDRADPAAAVLAARSDRPRPRAARASTSCSRGGRSCWR